MGFPALQSSAFTSAGSAGLFLPAHILFGGVLAFMGVNHFLNLADMAGYAATKGVPAPRLSVVFSGGLLVSGGLSVVTGAYVVGAGGLAVFLLANAVGMHDFWSVDDPQQRQTEMTEFLENVTLVGAAFLLVAIGGIA